MRFDKIQWLLALLIAASFSQEVRCAEPQQDWVRSAPPLAESSRYAPRRTEPRRAEPRHTESHHTKRYSEPKALPGIAVAKPRATNVEFNQRLTVLELALSTIVAEKPNLWRFDRLEAEATSLLMAAPGEKDRQAVREVATRIDTFAAIANRYRDARGSLAKVDRTKIAPPTQLTKAQEAPSQEEKTEESEAAALGYDAVGVLRSVVSKRPEAPKFALVDGDGKVTTFLTPSPDLHLQPMLGKRIGVKGSRGFMPAYKREHLTANRVTALDTVRR